MLTITGSVKLNDRFESPAGEIDIFSRERTEICLRRDSPEATGSIAAAVNCQINIACEQLTEECRVTRDYDWKSRFHRS